MLVAIPPLILNSPDEENPSETTIQPEREEGLKEA